MGMRSDAGIWVGFSTKESVKAFLKELQVSADEISGSEDPTGQNAWYEAYDDDDNLCGLGIKIAYVCPQLGGELVEQIDLAALAKKAEANKSVLDAFLREYGVSDKLRNEVAVWIKPGFG